jgi:hypothetical protein
MTNSTQLKKKLKNGIIKKQSKLFQKKKQKLNKATQKRRELELTKVIPRSLRVKSLFTKIVILQFWLFI